MIEWTTPIGHDADCLAGDARQQALAPRREICSIADRYLVMR